jgi:hypothetical protein
MGDFECKTGFWKHLPSHRLKKGRLHSQARSILGMQFPGGGGAPGRVCIPGGKLKKSSKGSTNLFAKKPQPGFRQKFWAAALHSFEYFNFEKKPRRSMNPAGLASAALLMNFVLSSFKKLSIVG